MSINTLKEGILEGNWEKVKQFYTSITGEVLATSTSAQIVNSLSSAEAANDFVDTGTEHLDDLKFMPKNVPGRNVVRTDSPKEITTQCIECHRTYTISTIFLKGGVFTCNKCVGGGGKKKTRGE